MVIAIIAILAAMLFPVLIRGKRAAHRARCISNLHQMGIATQMYWDDNDGRCFPYGGVATNGGMLYWFGWIGSGAPGTRPFDATQGALHHYLQGRGVEVCPSLSYWESILLLRAKSMTYGYGYNLYLSKPVSQPQLKALKINRPATTVLFADAGQVNNFSAPASPTRPMLEEFFYVDTNRSYPNGHFRHNGRANVVFCDGHVELERPEPGSIDVRLPNAYVGRLRAEILVLQ